jgi:putative hydrolase of the HAD superfamily
VIRPEADHAIRIVDDAGFKLAILSNELDLFYGADFRARLPVLARFDTIVDATHTHILKPDPCAYHSVLDALALTAEDCVFVDDQRRNIAGAAACNMRAVLFDGSNPKASCGEALRHFGLEFD